MTAALPHSESAGVSSSLTTTDREPRADPSSPARGNHSYPDELALELMLEEITDAQAHVEGRSS